jgi:hypothetical protein
LLPWFSSKIELKQHFNHWIVFILHHDLGSGIVWHWNHL